MKFVVQLKDESVEIEHYLKKNLNLSPASEIKRAFRAKEISLNGIPVLRDELVRDGDSIEIRSSEIFDRTKAAIVPVQTRRLNVLYESGDWIAVDKFAGAHSHPQNPSERDTMMNFVAGSFPETAGAFDESRPLEGGLVHRLDQGTSGVLIVARNLKSFEAIKNSWKDKDSLKIYFAWVNGDMKSEGLAEGFIAHHEKNQKKMVFSFTDNAHGLPSVSEVVPIYKIKVDGIMRTLVAVRIHTGVTHQVRVTLAALGFPIVGDELYANTKALIYKELKKLKTDTRTFLEKLRNTGSFATRRNFLKEVPGFHLHCYSIKTPVIQGEDGSKIISPLPDFFAFSFDK